MPGHGLVRMRARDPREPHRVASPLELFFDLVFVVAVSLSSSQLHRIESEQHIAAGIGTYLMVFFAIWWAWLSFTWFASAFDTDDWLYRVVTIVQMAGALTLAAGTPSAMAGADFTIVTIGYVVMRLAMVAQWLRVAHGDPASRGTALRYAAGISFVQVLWVLRLFLPESTGVWTFVALVAVELAVPVWAASRGSTPWHPGHITERHGLFTLIVLGESVLASTNAIVDAAQHTERFGPLIALAACGLVLAAGMWWIYFSHEHAGHLTGRRSALRFGYGHYFVFAAAGAFSAGIEVAIDVDTDETGLTAAAAAATVTVPVAVFVLAAWWLLLRPHLGRAAGILVPALAVGIALSAFAPYSLPLAAALVAAIVATLEVDARGRAAPA